MRKIKLPTYAVILVGGKGKRLRPLSTDTHPKAFLSVTGDRKTMFRKTVDRIKKLIPVSNIIVVANKKHSHLVRRELPGLSGKNLILEPMSRNTAPAIGLAASAIAMRRENGIMVVLPTDQYIMDEGKYLGAVKRGIDFIARTDSILVMGVRPKSPATGFGYIKLRSPGSTLDSRRIYEVEAFTEKPDLASARRFIRDGRYLWNTGAFIFRAGTMLKAMERYAPEIGRRLGDLSTALRSYGSFPNISIDYAVMEKASRIHCVKGAYRWQDMGSFESIENILKMESRDYISRNGKVVKIL